MTFTYKSEEKLEKWTAAKRQGIRILDSQKHFFYRVLVLIIVHVHKTHEVHHCVRDDCFHTNKREKFGRGWPQGWAGALMPIVVSHLHLSYIVMTLSLGSWKRALGEPNIVWVYISSVSPVRNMEEGQDRVAVWNKNRFYSILYTKACRMCVLRESSVSFYVSYSPPGIHFWFCEVISAFLCVLLCFSSVCGTNSDDFVYLAFFLPFLPGC